MLREPIARNQLVLTHNSSLLTGITGSAVPFGRQIREELSSAPFVARTSGTSAPANIGHVCSRYEIVPLRLHDFGIICAGIIIVSNCRTNGKA